MTTWLIKISLIILIWIFLEQEWYYMQEPHMIVSFFQYFFCDIYQKKGWKIDNRWKSYPYWLCSIYTIAAVNVPRSRAMSVTISTIRGYEDRWYRRIDSRRNLEYPDCLERPLPAWSQPRKQPLKNKHIWSVGIWNVLRSIEYYYSMWRTFKAFYWVYMKYSPTSGLLRYDIHSLLYIYYLVWLL